MTATIEHQDTILPDRIDPVVSDQPRWQDNWPSVAYSIDYDHEKNGEINPTAIREMMIEMGVPKHNIPELTLFVTNRVRLTGGVYTPEDVDDKREDLAGGEYGAKFVMQLPYRKNLRKRTKAAIHETQHFKDDTDNRLEKSSTYHQRQIIGAVLGSGALATSSVLSNDTLELLQSPYYPNSTKALYVGALGFNAAAGYFGGKALGYRTSPDERRAFRAAKNKPLVKQYSGKLYSAPKVP